LGGTIELLARLVISMAVVMAVMALAARVVRHRQAPAPGVSRRKAPDAAPGGRGGIFGRGTARKPRPLPPVEVAYRRALTKGAWVTVVDVGDRRFLVGATEHSVSLLTELRTDQTPGDVPSAITGLDGPALGAGQGFEDWPQTSRMPVCLESAPSGGHSDPAWKLTLESLRERTVRR